MTKPALIVVAVVLFGCSNESQSSTGDSSNPEGWHPVGEPLDPQPKLIEVTIVNTNSDGSAVISGNATERTYFPDCTERTEGTCVVRACREGEKDGASNPAARDAGTLSIALPTETLTLPAKSWYLNRTSAFWIGDATIGVSTTGGELAPFSADLSASADLLALSPELPSTDRVHPENSPPLYLDWSASIGLSWSGGLPNRSVRAKLSWTGHSQDNRIFWTDVECVFDAAGGSGEIPATLLSDVPKSDRVGATWLELEYFATKKTMAGDFPVTVEAQGLGRTPAGALAQSYVLPM